MEGKRKAMGQNQSAVDVTQPRKTLKTTKKLIVPVIYISLFLIGFYIAAFQLTGLDMVRQVGMADTWVSILVAIHFIGTTISNIAFGKLSDTIGKKKVIMGAVIAFIVGSLGMSFAPNGVILLIGIFIVGCGYGIIDALALAVLADAYPQKADRYINIGQMIVGIGSVSGPLICQALMDHYQMPWYDIFPALAGLGVIIAILLLFTNVIKVYRDEEEDRTPLPVKTIIKSKIFILLALGIFFYLGMENATTFFADMYFEQVVHMPELSAMAISGFWLAVAAVRLLAGIFRRNRHTSLLISFGISVICVIVITLIPNGIVTLVNYILLGALYGTIFPYVMCFASDIYPNNTGTATSLLFAAAGIGGGIMPMLLGGMIEVMSVHLAFSLIAVFAAVGFILEILLKREIYRKNITRAMK